MAYTGYRIYRGEGGPSNVDYSSPVAAVAAPPASVAGLGHEAGGRYCYVVRPVLDGLECPDLSCRLEVIVEATGSSVLPTPAAVEALAARVIAGGKLDVSWQSRRSEGRPEPAAFEVYLTPTPSTPGSGPVATVDCHGEGGYRVLLPLSGADSRYVVVCARTADGATSVTRYAGPYAAGEMPGEPHVYVTRNA